MQTKQSKTLSVPSLIDFKYVHPQNQLLRCSGVWERKPNFATLVINSMHTKKNPGSCQQKVRAVTSQPKRPCLVHISGPHRGWLTKQSKVKVELPPLCNVTHVSVQQCYLNTCTYHHQLCFVVATCVRRQHHMPKEGLWWKCVVSVCKQLKIEQPVWWEQQCFFSISALPSSLQCLPILFWIYVGSENTEIETFWTRADSDIVKITPYADSNVVKITPSVPVLVQFVIQDFRANFANLES